MIIARTFPLFAILGALACSGSRGVSLARPTSAQIAAAGSPELRTVDNAGFVDPAGRTRQVSAGGGPSPVGRGNEVAPLEHEHPSGGGSAPPAPRLPVPTPASVDSSELTERAARALCDREAYCGRLGLGMAFESADACMAAERDRVRRALGEASCKEIRGARVAGCLAAIRAASCGGSGVTVQPPPECTAHALCTPE